MKNSTQHEVLLIRETTFSTLQLCKKNESGKESFSAIDPLEEECWNGLLQEILPEIFGSKFSKNKQILWQIKQAKYFLELDWDEFPGAKDNFCSIDPYSFLPVMGYN